MAVEKRFLGVKDGSKLELETDGPKTGFRISAKLRKKGKKLKSWSHQDLTSGKRTRTLKSKDGAQVLNVTVLFTSSKTTKVEVTVTIGSESRKLNFSGKKAKGKSTKIGRVKIGMKKVAG